ncbi:unnamed protein product [Cuscuta europaea]|uniref:CCHC-type domain-containing protein n=1 Tax=Cuscuta europaea TaxID=41803 RepID=A0A9P0ZDQ1_CUSEU|nr:unnamed protein product [Cuscuta europaea]
MYSGKGNLNHIYEVCKAFYRAEMKDKPLTAYFMDFKKTYEELNTLMPFSPDIKVQQKQHEQLAIMSFLAGFTSDFETAKSHILSSDVVSSLQDAFSRVLRTDTSSTSSAPQPSNAFVGQVPTFPNGGEKWPRTGPIGKGVVCNYCKKPGHLIKDCRKLKFKNQGNQVAHIASVTQPSNGSIIMSSEEYAKFLGYQEALKHSSTPISVVANSGNPNTCLVSSSSK